MLAKFRSRRALLCFDGDNINSAVNPTFRASFRGLLPSEVLQMSGNFPLLFLDFHTVADRGRTNMILFVDCRSRHRAFMISSSKMGHGEYVTLVTTTLEVVG